MFDRKGVHHPHGVADEFLLFVRQARDVDNQMVGFRLTENVVRADVIEYR
jgi:hypothetical protein